MYILFYFLVTFLGFISDFVRNKIVQRITLPSILFICATFSGLRSIDVGADTVNYVYIIDNLEFYNFSLLEPLFLILNQVVNLVFNGSFRYTVMFLIVSGLTWLFFLRGAREQDISIGILLLVLFGHMNVFFDQFNAIRQLLALSIVFFSIQYLINKSYKKFIFLIFVSSLFHYTAILGLTLIPIYLFKKYWKAIILFSFFFLFLLSRYAFEYVLLLNSKYDSYKDAELSNNYIGNGVFLFNLLIFAFFIFCKKYVRSEFRANYGFFLVVVAVAFSFQLSMFFNSIGGDVIVRVSYYYLLGYVFLTNYVYMSIKSGQKIFFWLLVFLVFSFKFLLILNSSSLESYSILNYR